MPNGTQSKHRWYVLSLAAAINVCVYAMAWSCMPVLFSEIVGELGLSLVQVGAVWGASSMAGIFIMLFAGLLGDRFGAKRIIAIACLLAGLFGSLRGLSVSFISLAAASLLFGFAIEMLPVNVSKTASLWFHGRRLGMAQSVSTAGIGAGFMLGTMLSATVLSPLLGGWRNVLFLYGAVSVLIGLLWSLTVREPKQSEATGFTNTPPLRQALSSVARIRGVWLIAVTMLGLAGCYQSMIGYLPLYLRGSGWTAASADGALATLNAIGTASAVPVLLLSDRLGRRKAFLLAGIATAIIGVGLLSVVTGPLVWLLVAMVGVLRDASWALAVTMTIETKGVGPEYAGTAAGIVFACSRFGIAGGAPLGNSLAAIHPGLPFVLWSALAVVALLSLIFFTETRLPKERI